MRNIQPCYTYKRDEKLWRLSLEEIYLSEKQEKYIWKTIPMFRRRIQLAATITKQTNKSGAGAARTSKRNMYDLKLPNGNTR